MTDETFFIDDDRYAPFRLIGWWDQERLRRAKIAVIGAGALGNEVLKNLALLGVGAIYLVDFDTVENANLARSVLFRPRDRGRSKAEVAAAEVRELNPEVRIKPFHGNVLTEIGLGLFAEVDLVIGCLDNREARLWVNRSCWKTGTPWIDGGIQEINGVVKVFTPPHSACYECAMTETDYRLINLRYSCPLLRQEDLLAGKVPTAPTIASMIGGLQTQEALKLLHGIPSCPGEALVYNGISNQFYRTRLPFREDCLSHETYPTPIELPLSAAENTAAELFAAARPHFCDGSGAGSLCLRLDRDLVLDVICGRCGTVRQVMRPQPLVAASEAVCKTCGDTAAPRMEHAIAADSPLAGRTLAELGVPPYDVVRVSAGANETSEADEMVFLLAGDRERVMSAGLAGGE